jgi:hypothetical protein
MKQLHQDRQSRNYPVGGRVAALQEGAGAAAALQETRRRRARTIEFASVHFANGGAKILAYHFAMVGHDHQHAPQ